MVRVFANVIGDWGLIPRQVIPKTQKMVLEASLLNTQHYEVQIKSKVEQSRERVALSSTPWCSSCWKGSLQVTLDYSQPTQLILVMAYVDISYDSVDTEPIALGNYQFIAYAIIYKNISTQGKEIDKKRKKHHLIIYIPKMKDKDKFTDKIKRHQG